MSYLIEKAKNKQL